MTSDVDEKADVLDLIPSSIFTLVLSLQSETHAPLEPWRPFKAFSLAGSMCFYLILNMLLSAAVIPFVICRKKVAKMQ